MSLVINILLNDCIVVGGDRRTTCKTKNNNNDSDVRYKDSTKKVVLMADNIIVSYCGDDKAYGETTVYEFLHILKKSQTYTLHSLPSVILLENNKYNNEHKDITFFVSGYENGAGFIYRIETKSQTISLQFSYTNYGAAYDGIIQICHAIMNSGINYCTLSSEEGADLCKLALEATEKASVYSKAQSVGGGYDIYVMHRYDSTQNKWIKKKAIGK